MDDDVLLKRLLAQTVVLTIVVQVLAARTGCANGIAEDLRLVSAALHSRTATNIDPILDRLLGMIHDFGTVADEVESAVSQFAVLLDSGDLRRTE